MTFIDLLISFTTQLIMLGCIYVLVLVVIFLDLWSGIRKAKARGEFRSSYGLRKTVEKVGKYFNMLFVVTIIDGIQMLGLAHWNSQVEFDIPIVPVLTFLGAIFVCFVELKSIYEKADEKDKSKYQETAKLAGQVMQDKNTREAVALLFEYLNRSAISVQQAVSDGQDVQEEVEEVKEVGFKN